MATQRTLNRNLIVHNDLNIGYGTEVQERGEVQAAEQKIELVFIFRTLDEIRYLNNSKYTRVALHQANAPLIEYAFDATTAASDDGDEVLAPLPAVTLGRWLKVNGSPPTADTTSLADITHAINTTTAKVAGYRVWNTTSNRPVYAVGTGAAALWVHADGVTAHTPS